ncbi:hypothetical protein LXL04_033369 [Taraxacum kok-saghyz]
MEKHVSRKLAGEDDRGLIGIVKTQEKCSHLVIFCQRHRLKSYLVNQRRPLVQLDEPFAFPRLEPGSLTSKDTMQTNLARQRLVPCFLKPTFVITFPTPPYSPVKPIFRYPLSPPIYDLGLVLFRIYYYMLSEEVTNICLAELVCVVSMFVRDPGSSPKNCDF